MSYARSDASFEWTVAVLRWNSSTNPPETGLYGSYGLQSVPEMAMKPPEMSLRSINRLEIIIISHLGCWKKKWDIQIRIIELTCDLWYVRTTVKWFDQKKIEARQVVTTNAAQIDKVLSLISSPETLARYSQAFWVERETSFRDVKKKIVHEPVSSVYISKRRCTA